MTFIAHIKLSMKIKFNKVIKTDRKNTKTSRYLRAKSNIS